MLSTRRGSTAPRKTAYPPPPDVFFFSKKSQYSPKSSFQWLENQKGEGKGQISREKQSFTRRKHLQIGIVHLGKQPTTSGPHLMQRISRGWRKRSNTSRRRFTRVTRGGTRKDEGMCGQKRRQGVKRKISSKQRQKPSVSEASHRC